MDACCSGLISRKRRTLLTGTASGLLLGGSGLLGGCTTMQGGGSGVGSEYVIRNGYIVTMEPGVGDIPRGDIHVRSGDSGPAPVRSRRRAIVRSASARRRARSSVHSRRRRDSMRGMGIEKPVSSSPRPRAAISSR